MSLGDPTASSVAIVVVAYHRPASLESLLRSVPVHAERVVVVVDADPEVQAVAERFGATMVVLPGNPGYGAAVNAGARAVTRPVTVFMNDDLQLTPGALEHLAAAVCTTDGVVVPRIVDRHGWVEPTVVPLVSPRSLLVDWALLPDLRPMGLPESLTVKWRQPTAMSRIPAAMAAAVAVSTDRLRQIPLAEDYFLYWEEHDWCWQLERAGVHRYMEPAAIVRHTGGRADVRPEKDALLARNALRCVRRTQGRAAALRAWPAVLLWWMRLVLIDALRFARHRTPAARERLDARRAGLRAAVLGIREAVAGRPARRLAPAPMPARVR